MFRKNFKLKCLYKTNSFRCFHHLIDVSKLLDNFNDETN